MDQYEYLTRDQLISLVRDLGAGFKGGRGPAPGDSEGLPEFSERAVRDFESSSSPMRIFERETLKYVAVNDAAVQFYGYSRDEFLSLTLRDTRHPDEHADQRSSLEESKSSFRYVKPRRHVTKSGKVVVVELVTQDILFKGRKARLALTIDITGRDRALAFLRRREQEFDSLMTHSPDIVARLDRDFRHLYVTPAVAAASGRPPEEFIGKTISELGMPPDLVSRWDAVLKKAFTTGVEQSLECVFEGPSGARYYESRIVPEPDAGGSVATVLTITRDFTERKLVEELLCRREQEFESLAENLPDLVARYDRERRFLYANSAVERALGLDRGQILGKTQREVGLTEELASLYGDSLAGVFATGQPHKVEFRLALPSGERQYESYQVAEMDAAGTVGSVLCIARDITERKQIEKALSETNEFLQSVIESSRDCIKVLDLEGRLQLMNAGGRRLLEIDDIASLLDTEWLEFWRGGDYSAASAALDAARCGGVGNFEGYCPTLKGSPRWWDVVVTPILDANGKPARLLAVSRDVSRRKRARDVQSRLAAIVNYSMDAVVSMDLDGIIRTWNPAAEHLFGYREEEAVGQPVTILIPSDRRQESAFILECIKSGEPVESTESVRCRKDGTRVDVTLSISPIKDAAGRVIGASKIARDITERRRAELALLRSAALTQLLESLARAANDAVTSEAAMSAGLQLICRHGGWEFGRVVLYGEYGPQGAISLLTPRSIWHGIDRHQYAEFIRISENRIPYQGGSFISQVLRTRMPVWVEDLRVGPGFGRRDEAVRQGLRSAFAFPIIVREDVVAIIEMFSRDPRSQDSLSMGAAQSIASQLARIVEREWAHRASARMAAIVESSQDAVISRALDGTVLTWNPAAERLFGYTADEIVGRHIECLYPPELVAEANHRQKLLLEGRPLQGFETVRFAKGGRRIHVSTGPATIKDSSGKICGVSTIFRDISERKLAEQELLKTQQHLQVAVEGGNVGLWDWDVQAGTVYFSPEWKKQLGYEDHELPSRFEEWSRRVHPEDFPRVSAETERLLERPQADFQQEYRMRHRDGEYRWILSRASLQAGVNGKVLRMFGCHVDITDQKQAEAERLHAAMRQRDALVREVHHRIKNNLQGVAGLLRQKIRKLPAAAPGIEEAIVQLQAVAVVYGLQGTRADGMLNLADMVEAICASAEGLIGGHVDRIFEHKSARPACVAGSEAVSVAVALNELVFNALKHQSAPAGKKRARVVLCEWRDAAEIRITNRGQLPKRFDFSGGRAVGNGLGLVRTLLASPGADVEFSSVRNIVTVMLKLRPPLLADRQARSARKGENGGAIKEKAATAHSGRG